MNDPYILNFTLHNLTLSPGYHTNQSDASSGDFEFENSNTANTLLSLFTDHFQPASYFITVQAITASGRYITATSNGVVIDISPPEPIAPIDHFDVSFSNVQPVDFQASNDTISVRWAFRDLESGIIDYKWAIGTAPNITDIQRFISVGTSLEASNSGLRGVLEHNMTYYVTVVATNGAGLSTYVTSEGVTYSASVLNFTALEEVVTIEFVRSLVVGGEGGEGEEVLVVEQEDRAAIMWDGVSEDVEDICELRELMRERRREGGGWGEGGREGEYKPVTTSCPQSGTLEPVQKQTTYSPRLRSVSTTAEGLSSKEESST